MELIVTFRNNSKCFLSFQAEKCSHSLAAISSVSSSCFVVLCRVISHPPSFAHSVPSSVLLHSVFSVRVVKS